MVRSVVHLLRCLHVNAAANEVNISHLVSIFSPVLCRPPSGAFMSIRHIKALPHIQTALHTLIQHYDLVFRVRARAGAWFRAVLSALTTLPRCLLPPARSLQRANAWSAQAEAESYHHQVLVLAITEELLDGTVNSFFGDLDIASPSHITDEPARWAEALPSPRKARRSSSHSSDASPSGGIRGAGAGASAGSGGGALSGDSEEHHMRLTDVDTFNLSDDEDGGGGGSGNGSGKRAESGGGGSGSGSSGKEADREAGGAAEADAGARSDEAGTGRGVQRAAAAGLSLNISTSAQPVSAPVSPPTPWVASPSLAQAAMGGKPAVTRDGASKDHPRRPSGALRRKQVSEYRKVR